MHILITTISDPFYDPRILKTAHSLAQNGHNVHIIGCVRHPAKEIALHLNITISRIERKFLSGKQFYLWWNKFLISHTKSLDFDLLISIDLDTAIAGYRIQANRTCKWIIDAHEWFSELPEVIHRPFTRMVWKKLEQYLVPKADALITVSNGLADYYKSVGQPSVYTIFNYPNILPPDNKNTSFNNSVIYKGVFNIGRCLEDLVTVGQSSSFKVEMIGYGDIEQELHKLNKHNSVLFHGKQYGTAAQEIMKTAGVGFNVLKNQGNSYYYSMANKFFEYAQLGIPSINSNFPDYSEKLQEFNVGEVIDPNNIDDYSKTIHHILENREQYSKACISASKVWNWEAQESQLIQIIEGI